MQIIVTNGTDIRVNILIMKMIFNILCVRIFLNKHNVDVFIKNIYYKNILSKNI